MSQTDTDAFLLIGPLPPLLPRMIRLRLTSRVVVATAAALGLAVLAGTFLAVQSIGVRNFGLPAVGGLLPNSFASSSSHDHTFPVVVISQPVGATIVVEDKELGQTPAHVNVDRDALLRLRLNGFLDDFVEANTSTAEVALWRAQPDVRLVRPPLPGAVIRSANFLPDGQISLGVEIPPGTEHQVWEYDATAARMARLGQTQAPGGALPSVVAAAPDRVRTANVFQLDGLDGAVADQLELDGPEGRSQPLGDAALGERLLDLSWSPTSSGVLVVSGRRLSGSTSYGLRFVATSGQVRDVADLPEQPVSGSWVWKRDGTAVAFLVGPKMALAALDLATQELRYIADLQAGSSPSSGAVAPATWGASGELLYAGPSTSGLGGSSSGSALALFEVGPGRLDARRLGDVEPVWAPITRDDGIILTLARGNNDELILRPVAPAGHALADQPLGVQVSGPFAARWDLDHRQLLILRGATGGGLDVILLRFGADDSKTFSGAPAGGKNTGGSH